MKLIRPIVHATALWAVGQALGASTTDRVSKPSRPGR
jgi:hypothetical protein